MFNFSKSNLSKICAMAFLGLGVVACNVEPTVVTPAPVKGTADFSKYVSIGNSLTAGYADGGLYNTSISNSYPSMLAAQFSKVGGGTFIQPFFTAAGADGDEYRRQVGIPSATNTPKLFNKAACATFKSSVVAVDGATNRLEEWSGANGGAINNLGVPGIRISDVKNANYGVSNPTGQYNKYFERLLPGSTAQSYLDYTADKLAGATFFSLWLGNNDILGYATAGAPTQSPTTIALGQFLTDVPTFTANYNDMLNKATEGGRKGIVGTIPKVTTIPYFYAVTHRILMNNLRNAGQDTTMVKVLITTATGVRASNESDLYLLGGAASYPNLGSSTFGAGQPFPFGLHPNNPIPDNLVLDASEVIEVNNAVDTFNGIITAAANTKGLAIFDANALLSQVNSTAGFMSNGITYRSTYLQGGAFSTDGVHLTPAGYAVTANEMIKAINAKYGSTIPLINNSGFSTIRVWETLCQ